jgi:aminopeptidase N
LRGGADRYRSANATTEDFFSPSESISGWDIDSFFDRWL